MPSVRGVVETCLYVEDLAANVAFYRDLLGLRLLNLDERMAALAVADHQLLLLFVRGGTPDPIQLPGGVIPAHDGIGRTHLGLAIEPAEFTAWEGRLAAAGVEIISRVSWPRGGRSVYFNDPEQNLVELLTPGVWEVY